MLPNVGLGNVHDFGEGKIWIQNQGTWGHQLPPIKNTSILKVQYHHRRGETANLLSTKSKTIRIMFLRIISEQFNLSKNSSRLFDRSCSLSPSLSICVCVCVCVCVCDVFSKTNELMLNRIRYSELSVVIG